MLSICNRGVGGPASCYMGALVRAFGVDGLFPEDGAIDAVDSEDYRVLVKPGFYIVVITIGVLVFFFRRFSKGRCRGEKDPVAPDDGGRVPLARQCCLPADVFFFAPLDGGRAAEGGPGAVRPAPGGPLFRSNEVIPGNRCRLFAGGASRGFIRGRSLYGSRSVSGLPAGRPEYSN